MIKCGMWYTDVFLRSTQVLILSYRLNIATVTYRRFVLSVLDSPNLGIKWFVFRKKRHIKKTVLSNDAVKKTTPRFFFYFLRSLSCLDTWQPGSVLENPLNWYPAVWNYYRISTQKVIDVKHFQVFVFCNWWNFREYLIFVFKSIRGKNLLVW